MFMALFFKWDFAFLNKLLNQFQISLYGLQNEHVCGFWHANLEVPKKGCRAQWEGIVKTRESKSGEKRGRGGTGRSPFLHPSCGLQIFSTACCAHGSLCGSGERSWIFASVMMCVRKSSQGNMPRRRGICRPRSLRICKTFMATLRLPQAIQWEY